MSLLGRKHESCHTHKVHSVNVRAIFNQKFDNFYVTIHGSNQNEDGTYSWKFDNYVRNFPPIGVPSDEMGQLYGDITCPTLLVRGLESWASDPIADGRTEAFNCPLEVEAFAEAGHWVHHDQLEGFVTRVKQFLAAPA